MKIKYNDVCSNCSFGEHVSCKNSFPRFIFNEETGKIDSMVEFICKCYCNREKEYSDDELRRLIVYEY